MNARIGVLYYMAVLILLVLTLPAQLVIALVIVVTSGFPILFRQRRVGLSGRPFTIYKFRTMRSGAERQQALYRRRNEAQGPVFKIRNDPRYTQMGTFLAHTGLDELPQLFNVLIGDMSLIGPRPLPVAEVEKLKPWMRARHRIRPGIISPAILTGRYHEDFDAWMKSDIAYAKSKSLAYDVRLFLRAMSFLMRLFMTEIRGKS